MCKNKILIFITKLNSLDDYNYAFYSIAYGIAPTIYDRKPSSIITINSKKNMLSIWREYREEFCIRLGCKCKEFNNTKESVQVMFYKEDLLKDAIFQKENIKYLKVNGYNACSTLEDYLVILSERFKEGCPHEIGIFLGIPLEEIRAFIENNGEGYIVNSYWKVYCNMSKAQKIFSDYDNAKIRVMHQVEKIAC